MSLPIWILLLAGFSYSSTAQDFPRTPQHERGGTPADVRGPDGKTWYPDWTTVGVQGGIPDVKPVVHVESHGARANDEADDADAIQKACDDAGARGGGAVLLSAGAYYIDKKIVIRHDGVVLRGAGADKSRLIIRYAGDEDSKRDAIILFKGKGYGQTRLLTADAKRGATTVAVESTDGLKAGDFIVLHAPATTEWRKQHGGVRTEWDLYRFCMFRTERVAGHTVTVNQPLRIDFPLKDGSQLRTVDVIKNCGIEDLYLTQRNGRPRIQTVLFAYAVNCWGRRVTVELCGRNPIYAHTAKWVEIRDCTFNKSHNWDGGGTGYVGFEMGWDCLIDNVTTRDMRHAPNFEWSTSGCVVRNSTFINSDAQSHSGWCRENLIENCVIVRPAGSGSYGHGYYTTSPRDPLHGPIGPRNVIYNCDFRDVPGVGVVLSGMNENYLIEHNRFETSKEGILCKGANFDHVIRGNVFVLRDGKRTAVKFDGAGGHGVVLIDNQVFGGDGSIVVGGIGVTAERNTHNVKPAELPPRPDPEVPSIYEWQREKAAGSQRPTDPVDQQ